MFDIQIFNMRHIIKILLFTGIIFIAFIITLNLYVSYKVEKYIYADIDAIPNCYTAIVPGALVSNTGYPSSFLQDRLDMAVDLYRQKKIKRFLLSGDHGTVNYDEVNGMRKYLISKNIATKDIFLDHAGFDTYNSMVRAKEIFAVTDAIIVTQDFHLPRAIYIARSKGLNVYGIKADKQHYPNIDRLRFREKLAMVKAFMEITINKKARFSGEKIPITGNSALSYDEK
jgi:SanA protein